MKHRSIHIFILVAAILVVAPRASQELSDMKDALGQRLKSEIFNAFLSLQSADGSRLAPQPGDSLLASAGPASRGVKGRASATQVEVHARREVPAEVTAEADALTEPVVEIAEHQAETTVVPAPGFKFELHDTKVLRGRELAMIIPPDSDVTAPPPPKPAPRNEIAAARRATARRRAAEAERRAAEVEVNLDLALKAEGFSSEELRRQLNSTQTFRLDNDAARTWTKVLKVKRTAPKPAPAAPAPAARASCPKSPTAAPSMPVACGPSAVETFYATE
jgi:hypothetical protein